MTKTPSRTPKQLARLIEEKGFYLKRVKGSHHIYHHKESDKIVIIPFHKKDLPKGTFHSILKQAGIDKEEL